MILDLSLNSLGYIIISIMAAILGHYTWKRRKVPGGTYFSILMAAVSFWALVTMGEPAAMSEDVSEMFSLLSYISVTWAGPLWLLFVLDYGYRDRWPITKKTMLICVVPVIIILLAITNELHGLIWLRPGHQDLVVFNHGAGLWANFIYTYILLLAGFVLLIWTVIRSYKKNFLKAAALLLGTMMPMITSIFWMVRFNPWADIDITPVAMGITILLYTWSIFGQRLFDIKPVAREVLVNSMADGVMVLSNEGDIVDLNPAAMKMLGAAESSIEQPVDTVLTKWPELVDYCRSDKEGSSEILINGHQEPSWIEIHTSPLCGGSGKYYGRLITLRDITKRKLAEEEIKRSNESLQAEVIERTHIEEALRLSNEALHAEIAERKRAEECLEISLKEKELLLKEIHHRVKNNLQIISSLMSLQALNTINENTSAHLRDTQGRIKSMALIHERLYLSRDLARIDFKEYVRSLIVSLKRSYALYPGIEVDTDIDNVFLDIDTAIPCGLIINELVSNSLKYAFKDTGSGRICVSMCCENDLYRLVVSDDGVGLPAGMDFRNTDSLGLQLVVTLTEQLKGNIEYPDRKGATFIITFNKNKE
ncbi:histidine kinase N-terminal 7TM domain-containing protein [Methanooceanicella nereidis]|uniref:histidine kinase N-terminal 7TM domain-containing protein n=1 Tax=Methanooceanicella nereidis TaxID=2052831 RepID=UPI001E5E1EDE|nr:histidine kinase N-terminal 7TM domain-containing protein [Methanocella sp. CWC-04]